MTAIMGPHCHDCISVHLIRWRGDGGPDSGPHGSPSTGLIVGGAIGIPHLRPTVATGAGPRASAGGGRGAGE